MDEAERYNKAHKHLAPYAGVYTRVRHKALLRRDGKERPVVNALLPDGAGPRHPGI